MQAKTQKTRRTIISAIMLIALCFGLFAKLPFTKFASASAQAGIQPVGQSGDWVLTFNDDFSGTELNRSTWRSDYFPNGGNGEMQQYVSDNSHNNYAVQDGMLRIIARKETLKGQPYTSGIVHTKNRFMQKYGYFEIRMQTPKGKGYWPAFWMLPDQDDWIPEIDVTEILGDDPKTTYMTYHYAVTSGVHEETQSQYSGPDFSAGWHTFAVDWEPNAIVWYVDGVERKRITDTSLIPDMPLYMIANLAVGGNWPGTPDSSTVFPASLNIDYIRAWQKSSGTPEVTPQPSENNLLNNPSFESSASSWSVSWNFRNDLGATFALDSSTGANNTHASVKASLASSSPASPWVVALEQEDKNLAAGKSYTLTFWAKASSARPIHAIIQEQNEPYAEYTNRAASLTTTWTRYSYTFTTPSNTTPAMLNFNLADAAGSVWIDGVSLCQTGTDCTTSSGTTDLPFKTQLPILQR